MRMARRNGGYCRHDCGGLSDVNNADAAKKVRQRVRELTTRLAPTPWPGADPIVNPTK